MNPAETHGFRRWRRTRPFWGGVFAVLGGLELIAVPLAPMPLVVQQGMAGVASRLIGALLVTAGVLMWTQPAQRSFYGILAVLLSLASFLTSNFGGFFIGLLLGLVGGALGFAWSPAPAAPSAPERGRPAARAVPRGGRLTAIALPALLGFHLLSPTPTPTPTPTATPTPSATPACPDVPANGAGLSQDEARKLLQELKNVNETVTHGGATTRARSRDLTLTGDVVMYTTKMSSTLLGAPLTFTPESPLPLTLPYMVMTDVVSEQPAVTANGAQLSGLGIAGA